MLGDGWDDAKMRESDEDRRKSAEGRRTIDRGVSRDGSIRVVIRCKVRPITEKPFGYSLKYVRAVCASRWRIEWTMDGCRAAKTRVSKLGSDWLFLLELDIRAQTHPP